MKKLTHLLPFMEAEELKELAIKIINEEVKGVKLVMLYPFLKRTDLNEVIDLLIEKGEGRQLQLVLPFLSEEKLWELLQAVNDGRVENLSEHCFYPFLGKDKIKALFNQYVEELNEEDNESDQEEENDADE